MNGVFSQFGMIDVIENHWLESGKMIHDKLNNKLIIPEDGTVYSLCFLNGLDEGLEVAITIAKNKIRDFINKL